MSLTNVAFTVPGAPQGKGRARSTRSGMHYTPAKTVAYESTVALFASQAMAGHPPLQGQLTVEIDAVCPIPASWPEKRRQRAMSRLERPIVKPDWDNIGKAVSDGGNGVLWGDDKQIVECLVRKLYGSRPAVHVRVAILSDIALASELAKEAMK